MKPILKIEISDDGIVSAEYTSGGLLGAKRLGAAVSATSVFGKVLKETHEQSEISAQTKMVNKDKS